MVIGSLRRCGAPPARVAPALPLAVILILVGSLQGQEPRDDAEDEALLGVTGISYDPVPGGLRFDTQGEVIIPSVSERPHPVITRIYPCSPAEDVGLQVGDVMIVINGKDAREMPPPWRDALPGIVQDLTIRRGEELIAVSIVQISLADLRALVSTCRTSSVIC